MDIRIIALENYPIPREIFDLGQILHQSHVDEFPSLFRDATVEGIEEYFNALQNERDIYLVIAYEGTAIMGYALIRKKEVPETAFIKPRKIMFIHHIIVNKTYQRKNVGSSIMDAIKEFTQQAGLSRIELNVWSFNNSAKSLFESEGFTTTYEEMGYDLNDTSE